MASSEEWGDHLQSDVDTTSEETSSCGSEPEISQQDDNVNESENELLGMAGQANSNMHALNNFTVSVKCLSPYDPYMYRLIFYCLCPRTRTLMI